MLLTTVGVEVSLIGVDISLIERGVNVSLIGVDATGATSTLLAVNGVDGVGVGVVVAVAVIVGITAVAGDGVAGDGVACVAVADGVDVAVGLVAMTGFLVDPNNSSYSSQ